MPFTRLLGSDTRLAWVFLVGLAMPAQAGPPSAVPMCAVLPFENLSGRPGSAYLAGVIQQALYPAVERTGAWRLMERARLKELLREADLKAAGLAAGKPVPLAGVAVVILGEYRDDAGVVTVSARLVNAGTGEVVHQAQWVGHVSGLSDALPPRMAAALAGMPPPPETLPAEMAARFQ
ncbi:MAG: CsgG/HfaB family protein, partial [Planctomycetota bacterium]